MFVYELSGSGFESRCSHLTLIWKLIDAARVKCRSLTHICTSIYIRKLLKIKQGHKYFYDFKWFNKDINNDRNRSCMVSLFFWEILLGQFARKHVEKLLNRVSCNTSVLHYCPLCKSSTHIPNYNDHGNHDYLCNDTSS